MTTALLVLLLQMTPVPQTPPARPPAGSTQPSQSANADYTVGAQDVLNIIVLNADVFNQQKVPVDSDGMFQYLDIDRLKAAGLSIRQIQSEVRDTLIEKRLHTNPTVIVDVAQFRSQVVYVQGAIRTIGSVTITGNTTLISVLANAGWPIVGSGSEVVVTRKASSRDPASKGGELHIARKDLESGMDQTRVQDQDIIFVPEAAKVIVIGEVHNPGPLDVGNGTVTVLQIIGMVGGFTDRASKGGVKIQRTENGTPLKPIKVPKDLSTVVKPGDVITVGRRIM